MLYDVTLRGGVQLRGVLSSTLLAPSRPTRLAGWLDDGDFFMHRNAKWGFLLAVSLKQFLESGTGVPHPGDPSI